MLLLITSLCYLTDSSFFLPRRCSAAQRSQLALAKLPLLPQQPQQRHPRSRSTRQTLTPRQPGLKAQETRLSETDFCLLPPLPAKILLLTSVQVAKGTKNVLPFLQHRKTLIVEGGIVFPFRGLASVVFSCPQN